jgi:hypothetical protein
VTRQQRLRGVSTGAGLLALAAALWWLEPRLGYVGPISLGGIAVLASLPVAFYGVVHLWIALTPEELHLHVPTPEEEQEKHRRFQVRWDYENALREAMGRPRLEDLGPDGPWGDEDIRLRELAQEWAEEAIRGGLQMQELSDIKVRAREDVAARIRARRKAEFEKVSLGGCQLTPDGIICGTGETWEQHEELIKATAEHRITEAELDRQMVEAERAFHEGVRRKRLEAGIPLEEYEHEFWNEPGWQPAGGKKLKS